MHDVRSERTADGVAVVARGSGLLARLVAFVIGLPPAGTVFGIPMPRAWGPRGDSYEFVQAGRFHFHMEIAHPFTGLIVRHRGWPAPQA